MWIGFVGWLMWVGFVGGWMWNRLDQVDKRVAHSENYKPFLKIQSKKNQYCKE